ncbi:hypothetical protein HDU67_007261 [Dinochytrium kinnereticum]|nr:hypothetical protein HDU67_007261 [Dinochytrium kinnereticum]
MTPALQHHRPDALTIQAVTAVADSADPQLQRGKEVELVFGPHHVSWGQDSVAGRAKGGLIAWLASFLGSSKGQNVSRSVPYNFMIAVTKSSSLPSTTLTAYGEKAALEASKKPADPPGPFYIIIHLFDAGSVPFSHVNPPVSKKPVYRTVTFEAGDEDAAGAILTAFQSREPGLRKPVMFLMNPFGGVREATRIYNSIVIPMMTLAGLSFELKETTHKTHAENVLRDVDVNKYESIITISGDGVFHEAINGIMTRPDWDTARRLPLGTIGAGSSNAMNRNFDCMFAEYGALNVVKGQTRSMDVLSITHHKSKTVHFTHLNVAWAYIADLDIESDNLRWIGREKTTICALIRLIWLRRYRAHLHVLPIDHEAPIRESSSDSIASVGPPRTLHLSDHTKWPIYINPSKDPITYFMAGNLPWVSTDFRASPMSRLTSGFIDLSFSERITRSSLLAALLASKMPDPNDAKACKEAGMTYVKARGFRLEPLGFWDYKTGAFDGGVDIEEGRGGKKNAGGVLAVSGEPYEQSGISVEVHGALATVVVPPWMVEGENWGN